LLQYVRLPFTGWVVHPGAAWYWWLLAVIGDFLIAGGLFFGLLQLIPGRFRKTFIAIVTFVAGLVYSTEFFVPADPKTGANFMTGFTEQMQQITNVVYAFALGLGIYSLLQFHGKNLARKRSGWLYSIVFFAAFLAMMLAGFWKELWPSPGTDNVYEMLFQSSIVALSATMFSTVGFYIVSAAYRAFRIRSAEATLMLAAAFVVMVGQVPVGAAMTSWLPDTGILSALRLENSSYWILKQPNMAAWRGISFGIEIGALAMALRSWLSLERGSFFEREM
jgi:hypothetical protein